MSLGTRFQVITAIQIYNVIGDFTNTSIYIIPVIVGVIFGALLARTQHLKEKLKQVANTDSLTKLGNRHLFVAEISNEIKKSQRYKSPFSVILIDVDNFKKINDTYGHRAGDTVLQILASIVSESSRTTDSCARWGGEEFIVLLPHTRIDHAAEKAEKLRQTIEQHPFPKVEHITCSFGVTEYIAQENAYEEIVHRADKALYRAKDGGRNKVEICAR